MRKRHRKKLSHGDALARKQEWPSFGMYKKGHRWCAYVQSAIIIVRQGKTQSNAWFNLNRVLSNPAAVDHEYDLDHMRCANQNPGWSIIAAEDFRTRTPGRPLAFNLTVRRRLGSFDRRHAELD